MKVLSLHWSGLDQQQSWGTYPLPSTPRPPKSNRTEVHGGSRGLWWKWLRLQGGWQWLMGRGPVGNYHTSWQWASFAKSIADCHLPEIIKMNQGHSTKIASCRLRPEWSWRVSDAHNCDWQLTEDVIAMFSRKINGYCLRKWFRTQKDRKVYLSLSLHGIKKKPVAVLFIEKPLCNYNHIIMTMFRNEKKMCGGIQLLILRNQNIIKFNTVNIYWPHQ